jgi:hypothetical protein
MAKKTSLQPYQLETRLIGHFSSIMALAPLASSERTISGIQPAGRHKSCGGFPFKEAPVTSSLHNANCFTTDSTIQAWVDGNFAGRTAFLAASLASLQSPRLPIRVIVPLTAARALHIPAGGHLYPLATPRYSRNPRRRHFERRISYMAGCLVFKSHC